MAQDWITTEQIEQLTLIDNRRLIHKVNFYKNTIHPFDSYTRTTEGLRRTIYQLSYVDAIFLIFTCNKQKSLKLKISQYTNGLFSDPTTSDDLEKFTGYDHATIKQTIKRNRDMINPYDVICDCASGRNRYVFKLTPQQAAFYIAILSNHERNRPLKYKVAQSIDGFIF